MECAPLAVIAVVVKVATPEPLSEPVPSWVVPSVNVTVPVGVLLPEDGVTVAVKVTDCPLDIVVAEAVRVVVVTVSVGVPEENS